MGTKKRKKSYIIFLWIAIPLLIYISYIQINRSEVGDLHFIEIFSIDRTDDLYTVTALYNNASSESQKGMTLIQGIGNSVYSAYIDMSRKNSKELSLDHTAYFLIGQDAALVGLPDCLDFIGREPDLKTNAKLFVVQSQNTNKLLKAAMKDDFAPDETLDAITRKQTNNLKKPSNTLLHVLNDMNHPYNNLLLPYLVYKDKNMYLEGYATFKDQKLTGFLGYDISQAVDFFRNNLRTCPLELNKNLSVELSNIQVTPHIKLNKQDVTLNMKVKMDSTIKEAISAVDVLSSDKLTRINQLEQYTLMDSLTEILVIMKQDNLDLLDIGSNLEKQMNAETLTRNWETYLNGLKFSLSVDSATSKTYTIDTDQRIN